MSRTLRIASFAKVIHFMAQRLVRLKLSYWRATNGKRFAYNVDNLSAS